MYWFDFEQQQQLIDVHNELRASEPATNMQELVWDEQLAILARGHAASCNAWHRDGSFTKNK